MRQEDAMRLCSYVVRVDKGFAPNPFGGYCTLAACTPNHQGLKLNPGDWLVGNSSLAAGQKLVYAMRVSEVLDFDDYYRDPRFAAKKPRFDLTWREAYGDNIYYRDDDGEWAQAPTRAHEGPEYLKKDTRRPRVFISDHFYYFGENAPSIPAEFTALIRERQGCQCDYPTELVEDFVRWIESTYRPGIRGEPRDRDRSFSPEPHTPGLESRDADNARVSCAPSKGPKTATSRKRKGTC